MADSIKSLTKEIEDQEALIKSDMMPDKVKAKAKAIKVDLEKKIRAFKIAAERGGDKIKKDADKALKELEGDKPKKPVSKKAPVKKAPVKKAVTKKTPATEKFEITIDGKIIKFTDLKSKEACEKAVKAVKGRYKEQVDHKKATATGKKRAATVPVTKKVTDGLIAVTKKAVASIPKIQIEKHPEEVKKALGELEKAFENLFDKLEGVLGKKIPKSQRNSIFSILTKIEGKVDSDSEKKAKAKSAIKKEDGGIIDNGWSYLSLM
tara:strand:- start:3309 stop:4100 length:792 start_codon:yes stop_codon:yes gene_type:complete